MKTIRVGIIEFELKRKRVKNVNLRLNNSGQVVVSAPNRVPLSFISSFVESQQSWILQRRKELLETKACKAAEFIEGKTHYLWGQAYALKTAYASSLRCSLIGDHILLTYPEPKPDDSALIKCMDNWYRPQIKTAIPELLDKWQPIVGVKVRDWGVKKMRTKWGTCNIQDARIWLNLELAKYPIECLEYVLVHELTHLHERYHNRRFYALMTEYMPDWKRREKELEFFFEHKKAG